MKDNITIAPQPSVHFDWTEWLPYFEAGGLDGAQKGELIEILWALVLGFVDLSFTVGSIPETIGQSFDLKRALEADVLNSIEGKHDTEGHPLFPRLIRVAGTERARSRIAGNTLLAECGDSRG